MIVVMLSPKNSAMLHASCVSNIREIQARRDHHRDRGRSGDDTVRPHADHIIEMPAVSTLFQPLLSTVPLQVFAARWPAPAATTSGQAAQPAKSVTVE